jgi:ferredoxin/flavodoxin
MQTHYIAWFSAAGTTRQAAHMLAEALHQHGIEARMLDLSPPGGTDVAELAAQVDADACLWLGSPVYVDHAVPQVLEFIAALPQGAEGAAAVPFVTWGGVCSGVALPEMAQHLKRKGWKSAGAAKVMAQHSSLWESKHPLGEGHPGPEDEEQLASLVDRVLKRLESDPGAFLDQEVLNYLPDEYARQAWEKSLAKIKAMFGAHQPDKQKCNKCGTCVELCPVGALHWQDDGYPQVTDEVCVRCHQCTRHCPQHAFAYDGAAMEERLHQMAQLSPEAAQTRIYV